MTHPTPGLTGPRALPPIPPPPPAPTGATGAAAAALLPLLRPPPALAPCTPQLHRPNGSLTSHPMSRAPSPPSGPVPLPLTGATIPTAPPRLLPAAPQQPTPQLPHLPPQLLALLCGVTLRKWLIPDQLSSANNYQLPSLPHHCYLHWCCQLQHWQHRCCRSCCRRRYGSCINDSF